MRALLLLIPLTLAVAVVGTAAHETAAANVEAAVNRRLLVLPPHATVGEALLESRTVPTTGCCVPSSPIRWSTRCGTRAACSSMTAAPASTRGCAPATAF